MMVVLPHFDDKNLDRWMAKPRPVQNGGGLPTGDNFNQAVDLSEALKNFHIASRQAAAITILSSFNKKCPISSSLKWVLC